ncbi:MAG: hypothetical protein ACRBN8_42715 [Nannocystales bacterium]
MKQQHQWFGSISLGVAFIGGITLGGCEQDSLFEKAAEQCGLDLTCSGGGFLEGKASISGVASIDSFFGAAIDLDASMVALSGGLRARLDAIGASVGLEPGATGAELQLAIENHLEDYISGGLSIDYQPARCEASIEAGIAAAAECDVDVDPGEVSASCSGSCALDVQAGAECSTDAELVCTGTAPGFACEGTCSGSCVAEFSAAADCGGTCRGTCTLQGGTEIEGFDGRCDGTCEGECATEMSAGGSCDDARCEGSCEYTPLSGECEAGASARCEAMAGASIECDAGCEGTVDPPSVSAECEATVDAKASASIECTPPTLAFSYRWAAGVDANSEQQAKFRAWLEGFRANFSALVAAQAEAEVVANAAANLILSADGALRDAVAELQDSGEVFAAVGAGCALLQLPDAAGALSASSQSLQANASATVTLVGAFGSS